MPMSRARRPPPPPVQPAEESGESGQRDDFGSNEKGETAIAFAEPGSHCGRPASGSVRRTCSARARRQERGARQAKQSGEGSSARPEARTACRDDDSSLRAATWDRRDPRAAAHRAVRRLPVRRTTAATSCWRSARQDRALELRARRCSMVRLVCVDPPCGWAFNRACRLSATHRGLARGAAACLHRSAWPDRAFSPSASRACSTH